MLTEHSRPPCHQVLKRKIACGRFACARSAMPSTTLPLPSSAAQLRMAFETFTSSGTLSTTDLMALLTRGKSPLSHEDARELLTEMGVMNGSGSVSAQHLSDAWAGCGLSDMDDEPSDEEIELDDNSIRGCLQSRRRMSHTADFSFELICAFEKGDKTLFDLLRNCTATKLLLDFTSVSLTPKRTPWVEVRRSSFFVFRRRAATAASPRLAVIAPPGVSSLTCARRRPCL